MPLLIDPFVIFFLHHRVYDHLLQLRIRQGEGCWNRDLELNFHLRHVDFYDGWERWLAGLWYCSVQQHVPVSCCLGSFWSYRYSDAAACRRFCREFDDVLQSGCESVLCYRRHFNSKSKVAFSGKYPLICCKPRFWLLLEMNWRILVHEPWICPLPTWCWTRVLWMWKQLPVPSIQPLVQIS